MLTLGPSHGELDHLQLRENYNAKSLKWDSVKRAILSH